MSRPRSQNCSERPNMRGADIVLYGHTHMPSIEEANGILFINPGSMKTCMESQTMAILHIEKGEAKAEICYVNPLPDPMLSST